MDGKAVEVISVGNCFAGVAVEKGEHLLKLEFHPPFWSVGSIASLTGLILLLIMYICKERNATICFGRIETITEILYLFVFWGAVLVVYIIPTVAITIHMTGRIVKLLL